MKRKVSLNFNKFNIHIAKRTVPDKKRLRKEGGKITIPCKEKSKKKNATKESII